MHLLNALTAAVFIAQATAQQKAYQGFNSGATLADSTAKKQSDFEAEFKTAQALSNSPGSFNSVRLYTNVQSGTKDSPIEAFPAAITTNTSMLLGIWCSGTNTITSELTALKAAITQYGQPFADLVVGISVGSEDLYRVSKSGIANAAGAGAGPTEMVAFIKQVRSAIENTSLNKKPVGHVDSWSAWANSTNKPVIDAVDFVGMDLYPYFEKDRNNTFANADSIFNDLYNQTQTAAGNKPVWITETGWPSSGPDFGSAVASVDNARTYWDQIGCRFFGRTNIWWFDLRDSNPADKAQFAITKDLATTAAFNLTCPADSGAPAPVNVKSAAVRISCGLYLTCLCVLMGSVAWLV
jgi:glucan endo-1,3-beta-D-glucosidase